MRIKRYKKEYSIQAVDNSLDVLEQFMQDKSEIGITELSQRLGLHKNNTFRLLATLENRNYIEQDPVTGNYKLGAKILELSFTYHKHNSMYRLVGPVLEELTTQTQENSYFGVLKNNYAIYVDHFESEQVLKVNSRIGVRLSPMCTAIGKAILAYLSDEEINKVLKDVKLEKQTDKTITDVESFLLELKKIKENGYAIDNEESDIGVTCVAAPVFNYEKKIIAGVSISGPTSRLVKDVLEQKIIKAVVAAGNHISNKVGYIE